MAFLMDEINEVATQRRLDEITTSGVRALDECAERSAKIDEQARESNARQAAELKAMEEERAERERVGAPAEPEQPAASVPWPTRESKPRVLSFAGEDFAAEQANAPTPPTGFTEPMPAPQPPPAPESAPSVPPRDHLLSFGVEDDEVTPPPVPPRPAPPARSRPPADLDDDDFSDQSWVR